MSWIDRILGKKDATIDNPDAEHHEAVKNSVFSGLGEIKVGRYSDNNKSHAQLQSWYIAEDRYKEKNYEAAFKAFFDYLKDPELENVIFQQNGNQFSFTIYQSSKIIYGKCDGDAITANAALALMEIPGTAVMRRLLEMNYKLYYCHSAMDESNNIQMVFYSKMNATNPSKLYYGLRELANTADRQDDVLFTDFSNLKSTQTEHIRQLPEKELEIKYRYFRKWIEETLAVVADVNADSYAGAIAYVLLDLIYRIDFLILPEASLLAQIEQINKMYWEKKDQTTLVARNEMMKSGIKKLLDISREEFDKCLFHSKSTFSISTPPKPEKVKEYITSANKDAKWYIENKHPEIALLINEYGVLYNQFIYSMPSVQTELITIYTAVLHSVYFAELGIVENFWKQKNVLNAELIKKEIDLIIEGHQDKFKNLSWDHSRISYESLYEFGKSFSEQLAILSLETKRD